MELATKIILSVISVLVLIGLYSLIKYWIVIYNKFVYWKTRLERKFADIDIIIQQRVDMIHALAQVAKKYSIHEYKTIKDTIEARSRWSKDSDLNNKVQAAQEIENNFIKLQAVFERYPKLKADKLYENLMGHGNISKTESRLREFRLSYNRIAGQYNERVRRFPRNIVAMIHGFKEVSYLNFSNQEPYKAKEIFND